MGLKKPDLNHLRGLGIGIFLCILTTMVPEMKTTIGWFVWLVFFLFLYLLFRKPRR